MDTQCMEFGGHIQTPGKKCRTYRSQTWSVPDNLQTLYHVILFSIYLLFACVIYFYEEMSLLLNYVFIVCMISINNSETNW